jgi:hypothetical protein
MATIAGITVIANGAGPLSTPVRSPSAARTTATM